MPISQRGGVQSLESTAETVRLANVQDYEDWLARMSQVETVIEQTMELQEEGRKNGYMPPRVLMERIPAQIDAQLVEDAGNQSFLHRIFGNAGHHRSRGSGTPARCSKRNNRRVDRAGVSGVLIVTLMKPICRPRQRPLARLNFPTEKNSTSIALAPTQRRK